MLLPTPKVSVHENRTDKPMDLNDSTVAVRMPLESRRLSPRDEVLIIDGNNSGGAKAAPDNPQPMARGNKPKRNLQPAGLFSTSESQSLIRRRLKADLPKARRNVIKNRIELCLPTDFARLQNDGDFPQPLINDTPEAGFEQLRQQEKVVKGNLKLGGPLTLVRSGATRDFSMLLPNPRTMLGTGRVDPFAHYPIPMTSSEQWLLDRVNIAADPNSFTFKNTWLPTAAKDATSFHQFLANVSLDLHWANGRNINNPTSVGYHVRALKEVNDKLSNPESSLSESVVFSITGFMCYDLYHGNFSGFDIHIGGLARIIALRGGEETLNRNPLLRCMVFGVDLSAACRRDTRPRFKFPEQVISNVRSDILKRLHLQYIYDANASMPWWLSCLPDNNLLNKALYDTRIAIEFTKYKEARGERWRDVKFLTYWIDPILHSLVGNLIPVVDTASVMQEATRLGLILFLSKLRHISGQLGLETKLFVNKLKTLLLHGGLEVYLESLETMLLWIVVIGLLESWNGPERIWYLEMTVNLAMEMNLGSWDVVVEIVRKVLMVDVVFESDFEQCREQFDRLLVATFQQSTDRIEDL